MEDDPSIELLARWRAGDSRAEDELFSRYTSQLIAMARRHISAQFARRFDAEDIVQSAYRCFWAAARADKVVLGRSGDLWRLLATITLRRVSTRVGYNGAIIRSVRKEKAFGGESSL